MTDEIRKQLENEAYLNIQKLIKNSGEVFFEITKDENGFTLEYEDLKYRIEKNNENVYDDSYGLIIFKDDDEIKFTKRPIPNGASYDEFAILLEKF